MALAHRGMLIHVTHLAPGGWIERKDTEEPFDLAVALDLLPLMADSGMNLLVVDIEDGVIYKSDPELTRHYSVPIEQMRTLADAARDHGMDVVPKLNFSKSGRNLHDKWMMPHWHHVSWLKGIDTYFRVAEDLIAELTEVMGPRQFFHIGMDEDHYRSMPQYVDAIHRLQASVTKQGLRTIIWNDSCHDQPNMVAQVHAEKSVAAESLISKDIVHILWDYFGAHPDKVKRVASHGFEVWGAPGTTPDRVAAWRRAVEGNGGNGLLLTRWSKCSEKNRQMLTDLLKEVGPGYRPA